MSSSIAGLDREGGLFPRHGVITLSGYGINIRVDKGHLLYEDGVGSDRRRGRLPRVGHGLKRLVVIGADGQVSLSALSWLADQNASFSMLDRDGSVLATTGPVRPSDAKLRRAQAMALQNGMALRLSRELVDRKLSGQQKVAIEGLGNDSVAQTIRRFRSEIAEAETIDAVRQIEAKAAKVYWSSWRSLPVMFPRKDLPRVPEHWLTFGSRTSSLTSSPRLATNPLNAILNYLYAVLEAESRLAAATLGLDPGIGVLHLDAPSRDSLACDLMEPIRSDVDAFVLDWLKREPLLRNSFFEQRDGSCRLMAQFASKLSQTAPTWARLVAPVAEWFTRELSKSTTIRSRALPSRLTQQNRRDVRGAKRSPVMTPVLKTERLCRTCGKEVTASSLDCIHCSKDTNIDRLTKVATLGRVASHAPVAEAKRAATQQINTQAAWDWNPADQPSWLTQQFYSQNVQPILVSTPASSIAKLLKVSRAYAGEIRKGRVPHPRHWRALAELVGRRLKDT